MTTDVIPYEGNPGALMTRATDVAGVCGEIVKRTARFIQGRKYVQVEGWQSIAAAYGCVASSTKVEKIEGGVRAIGELHRASDGQLLATAEGFVGEDEPTWYGGEITDKYGKKKVLPKRSEYAIRAMAQTRAISRVCRSAFAFVVVLIDSNLSTTPAEEMGEIHDEPEPKNPPAPQPPSGQAQPPAQPAADAGGPTNDGKPFRTRSEILIDLCNKAGTAYAPILRTANVKHADEMSELDYDSAVRYLNRKISSLADAATP